MSTELCPACQEPDCHYNELRQVGNWHPAPAPIDRHAAAPDRLKPIWRCEPRTNGCAAIALDPREAIYVLANGCTLDGIAYRASLEGWDGIVELDGRVTLRIEPVDGDPRP